MQQGQQGGSMHSSWVHCGQHAVETAGGAEPALEVATPMAQVPSLSPCRCRHGPDTGARYRPVLESESLSPRTAATDRNPGKSTHVTTRCPTCCLLRKASFWRCIQSSLAARMSARSASRCASCTQQGPQILKPYPTHPSHDCKTGYHPTETPSLRLAGKCKASTVWNPV